MNQSKTCRLCKQTVVLSNFNHNKASRDGYKHECKKCLAAKESARRKLNPERFQRAEKKYHSQNPEKRKELWALYFEQNKEVIRQKQKDYRLVNKDKEITKGKKYRDSHKQVLAERRKAYVKENPHLIKSWQHKRRNLLAQVATFYISPKEFQKLYSSSCTYCGSDKNQTLDHVIPISKGGRHSIGNLVTACRSCNSSKNNKLITEWRKNA